MKNAARLLIVFFGFVIIAGCARPMVELQAVNKNHTTEPCFLSLKYRPGFNSVLKC